MKTCVVNVVTGGALTNQRFSRPGNYYRGQLRLKKAMEAQGERVMAWSGGVPRGCPEHYSKPYAFKAWAMQEAAQNFDLILWADACIIPTRSLTPLWDRIREDGYWLSNNWWTNYDWTAYSAYPDLFPDLTLYEACEQNKQIMHCAATCFGLNVRHAMGKAFLGEYFRLAQTQAFCGPWINSNYNGSNAGLGGRMAPCGPPDVRGHRHDQTAASVIAWRLGWELTTGPNIFSYPDGANETTILVADGAY
jgi:hypothetical protein